MAKRKARAITELTIKKLYALSGNKCAFPGCTQSFFDHNGQPNVSNICHIEAAEKGGQRYNSNSDDEYRRSFENLILLCPNHHKITDDVEKFPVSALRDMKKQHEEKFLQSVIGQDVITKNPSALNIIIGELGSKIFDDQSQSANEPMSAPDPEDKIQYNNVVRFKPIIEEYKVYQGRLNKIYEEIEKQGSTRKEFVLRNINNAYLIEKGKYNSDIEQIRGNADNIIESVQANLWQIIDNSNNKSSDLPIEAIEISLYVILVDAFMRCSILEEPPQNDSK